MDSTILGAAAAILGSVVGAVATIAASWGAQQTQATRNKIEARLRRCEALYGEFITEASRLTVDGFNHQLEHPGTFVNLYGILGRIRLVATDPVLASAEACCRQVVELYAKPNMTIDEIRAAFDAGQDPIKDFSVVCRNELHEIDRAG